MLALLSRYWWVLVVRDVMAIALGVFAFVWPQETIAALVLVFGAIALVDGAFAVVASIAGHALTLYWWVLLQGLLGIQSSDYRRRAPDLHRRVGDWHGRAAGYRGRAVAARHHR